MKIIGITGTSGSGKTQITEILSKKPNVVVVSADQVAKELSIPNTPYMQAIYHEFGQAVFLENGNLNRKALADKIYNYPTDLEKLNQITFTYVVKEIKERIAKIQENQEVEMLILDAPLLIEGNLHEICDYVIVVLADEKVKVQRICKRDGLDEQTALKRLHIQEKNDFYIQYADFIITNNDNQIETLENKIEQILYSIKNGNR